MKSWFGIKFAGRNRLMAKEAEKETAEEPPPLSKQEVLLTEIRDLLKK
jgi:large-conductance mechanosensitive channel